MLDLYKNNIVSNAAYALFGKNVNIGLIRVSSPLEIKKQGTDDE